MSDGNERDMEIITPAVDIDAMMKLLARGGSLNDADVYALIALAREAEALFMVWDARPSGFEEAQEKAAKLTSIIDRIRGFLQAAPQAGA